MVCAVRLVIRGDSAGGHLALVLIAALQDTAMPPSNPRTGFDTWQCTRAAA